MPSVPAVAAAPVASVHAPGSVAWWEERQERLRRRRPRAEGLTIERIVAAAVALVDADGLDALTVRGLAGRLGTGSATLYRHVASRDELLVLIVDHVLGEVPEPSPSLAPRAQVEALATGLREVLLRHANLVPALSTAPLQGPNAVRGTALGLLALVGDGHPPEVAVAGYLALLDYVLGSVLFDSARAGRHGDGDTNPGRLPDAPAELVEAVQQSLTDLGSDAAFAFGLRTFLDGLARR